MSDNVRVQKNPFLRFFPTPTFLAMPSVGLSFSDTHIRFVEFVRKGFGHTIELGDYATVELPKGVVVDGDIREARALTDIILEMRKDFDFMYVRSALPEQKGYLYKTEVPFSDEGDLRDGVGFSIEENVPLSISEAIFDYDVVRVDHKKKIVEVVVTVFPSSVIQNYISVLESAQLTPLAFELEAHAVARALVSKEDSKTYIVVNQVEGKVGLYVVSNNVVHFTTTITLGHESIAGSGGAFSSQRKLGKGSDNHEKNISEVKLLQDEIAKLSGYWVSQGTGEEISAVILSGTDAFETTYQNALADSLQYPVRVGNVWENVFSFDEYIPDIPVKDALLYAAAVGLALPDNG